MGRGLIFVVAAAPLVAASCANGTVNTVDLTDSPDATQERTVVPIGDGGLDDVTTNTDGNPGTDSGCAGKVVINELKTDGPGASDEFVELFNDSTCAVPLGNWEIKYESASGGASPGAGYKFMTGESIASKAYFLVASASFVGKKDALLNPGFAAASGQVGLLDDKGAVVDGVAYGTVSGGDYREKSAAPSPVSGKSIGRLPNGVDTDNNAADWKALAAISPGAAN